MRMSQWKLLQHRWKDHIKVDPTHIVLLQCVYDKYFSVIKRDNVMLVSCYNHLPIDGYTCTHYDKAFHTLVHHYNVAMFLSFPKCDSDYKR